jgi:predicted Rossmann fold nucleotide-binding protein DprA/Smf involved in DNA uptake
MNSVNRTTAMPVTSANQGIHTILSDDKLFDEAQTQHLHELRVVRFSAIGNTHLLATKKLGLLCSNKCPGKLILQTHDLLASLHGQHITVVGGFHSPIEKECLNILLRGDCPTIICPARSLDRMRIPRGWKTPLDRGRMLLLSAFSSSNRRPTRQSTVRRNCIVAALADKVFIPYAAPGSKTETLAKRLVSLRQEVLTIPDDHNSNLLDLVVRAWC